MRPPTIEQIRAAIDGGQSRDKIVAPDPAAVPLGADEEAARTPIPPRARRIAAAAATERPARRWQVRSSGRLDFILWLAATVALFAATLMLSIR